MYGILEYLMFLVAGPTPETDRPIPQDSSRTQNTGFGEAQPVPEGAQSGLPRPLGDTMHLVKARARKLWR